MAVSLALFSPAALFSGRFENSTAAGVTRNRKKKLLAHILAILCEE